MKGLALPRWLEGENLEKFTYLYSAGYEDGEFILILSAGTAYPRLRLSWDDEKNLAGPTYKYYEKLIIKDMDGKVLDERLGNLFMKDSQWWLS